MARELKEPSKESYAIAEILISSFLSKSSYYANRNGTVQETFRVFVKQPQKEQLKATIAFVIENYNLSAFERLNASSTLCCAYVAYLKVGKMVESRKLDKEPMARKIKELEALQKALNNLSDDTCLELGKTQFAGFPYEFWLPNTKRTSRFADALAPIVDDTLIRIKKQRTRRSQNEAQELLIECLANLYFDVILKADDRLTFSSSPSSDFYNFIYEIFILLGIKEGDLRHKIEKIIKFYN